MHTPDPSLYPLSLPPLFSTKYVCNYNSSFYYKKTHTHTHTIHMYTNINTHNLTYTYTHTHTY